MIVTCQEGDVFRIHEDDTQTPPGVVTQIASNIAPGAEVEGPAVVPPGFGLHGGEVWVADEANFAIHAIKNNDPTGGNCCGYTVTPNFMQHAFAEGVYVIPNPPCTLPLRDACPSSRRNNSRTGSSGIIRRPTSHCPLQGWVATLSL